MSVACELAHPSRTLGIVSTIVLCCVVILYIIQYMYFIISDKLVIAYIDNT